MLERSVSLVIPVANEPRNLTLPLALWSADKYAPWLKVVLVGDPTGLQPLALSQPSGHCLPFLQQSPFDPLGNTTQMLRLAAHTPNDIVTDPFIWSNDDIYFRRPVTLDDVRTAGSTARGDLRDVPVNGRHGKRAGQTRATLEGLGLPTWDYERHVPLLIHKDDLLHAVGRDDVNPRSMYLNHALERPSFIQDDVKAFRPGELAALPDSPFFSTGHRFPISAVADFLGYAAADGG